MKSITFCLIASLLLCSVISGCGLANSQFSASSSSSPSVTASEADTLEIERVVGALAGSQLAGGSSWSKIEGDGFAYDLALTTFYCIMNPEHTMEIPADKYEAFMQSYMDVSVELMRKMQDYDAAKQAYIVSYDVSVDRSTKESKDFYRFGDIELTDDGMVKVPYRIIWGKMAEGRDENDTVFAGYILLEQRNGVYYVCEVKVTEEGSAPTVPDASGSSSALV